MPPITRTIGSMKARETGAGGKTTCRNGLAFLICTWVLACTPTYDWRDLQVSDAPAQAVFPCRPDRFSRAVALAGTAVRMQLASCTAAGTTFGLSHVRLADASQVDAALQALRRAATDNIGGAARPLSRLQVPGAAAHPLAERLRFESRRPDGSTLRAEAAFFTAGTHVYQASVVGAELDAEAVDTFFAGLRLVGE